MSEPQARRPRVVLGVTAAQSLRLLSGFPEYLCERGWDVHVVAAEAREPSAGEVKCHALPMRREPSPLGDLVALTRWVSLLCRVRPDIVVVGTPKAGLLGSVAAWIVRVPIRVYMLRGLRLETESGNRRRLFARMEWLTSRASTHVQAVSRSLADLYIEMKLAPARKVTVVGSGSSNGVEIGGPPSLPDGKPCQDRPFTVGFVGRVTPDKGVDTLLRAAGRVTQRGTEIRVHLVGGEESRGYLHQALLASSLTSEQVTRTGQVPDPENQYAAMDVLCLPTLREGFPNVVLEAAVQGVPTVASRVTGCVDAIVDGETGRLVPPRDPEALSQVLLEWAADREIVRELGRCARERAAEQFDRQDVWRRTERYYAGLLALNERK